MTVNLKSASGKEVFAKLAAQADVLVENFRPGVLARLGFGSDRLRELNPRLVYCTISGFGQTGPMRDRPAYDQIVQGLSGMMSVTGTPETAPLHAGYPIGDTLGGMSLGAACPSRDRSRAGTNPSTAALLRTRHRRSAPSRALTGGQRGRQASAIAGERGASVSLRGLTPGCAESSTIVSSVVRTDAHERPTKRPPAPRGQ